MGRHQWQPPTSTTPTTSTDKVAVPASTNATIALPRSVASAQTKPASSLSSDSFYCPECSGRYETWDGLSTHYFIVHATSPWKPCSVCQTFVVDKQEHYRRSPKHPKCTVCSDGFEDTTELQKHLAGRGSCDVCNEHIVPPVTMDEHYRLSSKHPKCGNCSKALKDRDELEMHSRDCRLISPSVNADMTPVAEELLVPLGSEGQREEQNDSEGTRGAAAIELPVSPSPSQSEKDVLHQVSICCSLILLYITLPQRDEPQGGTPSVVDVDEDRLVVMQDEDDVYSISRGSLQMASQSDTTTQSEPALDHGALLYQPFQTVSGRDEPQHSALSNGPSDTPDAAFRAPPAKQVEADSEPNTMTQSRAPESSPSWHCRSCLRDPCKDPIATVCGHVFCEGCIVRELLARLACPVCERTFFIRLDV
ncbi:hypothetical protein BD311DRAFT_268407 [Dichomitus squalens]|uniref:RING-type domain-containing protein n=1 Tax=Dichomitus squalens TaxID=114155 RepID=A0A4Q9MQN3_9APHY|nr:hypothetical protein BD311DRAFT_268407 [Dichomitus squalens]